MVPARRDSFTASARPIWLPILSAPAAASRLVTRPRSTFATSQPTKPITAAPNTFGSMSSSLPSMPCTGSSSPRRSKAARMLGMNSRITSQKSTLATVLPIGSMPASLDSRAPRELAASARATSAWITVAITHATSIRMVPAIRRGA